MSDDIIAKMQADILWLKTELAAATGRVHADIAAEFHGMSTEAKSADANMPSIGGAPDPDAPPVPSAA